MVFMKRYLIIILLVVIVHLKDKYIVSILKNKIILKIWIIEDQTLVEM